MSDACRSRLLGYLLLQPAVVLLAMGCMVQAQQVRMGYRLVTGGLQMRAAADGGGYGLLGYKDNQ